MCVLCLYFFYCLWLLIPPNLFCLTDSYPILLFRSNPNKHGYLSYHPFHYGPTQLYVPLAKISFLTRANPTSVSLIFANSRSSFLIWDKPDPASPIHGVTSSFVSNAGALTLSRRLPPTLRMHCHILTQGLIVFDIILIPSMHTFFFESITKKNSDVKCAWSKAISVCLTGWEVFSDAHKWGQSYAKKTRIHPWS
jgi:hypothetical protein